MIKPVILTTNASHAEGPKATVRQRSILQSRFFFERWLLEISSCSRYAKELSILAGDYVVKDELRP